MANILDSLIAKIPDPAMRVAISAEVARLRDTREFGLVFERHLPESVRLPAYPIQRGVKVQRRADMSSPTRLVRAISGDHATLADPDGTESTARIDDLIVISDFGEPIYPGLRSVCRIDEGAEKPFHIAIKAENYHALQALSLAYDHAIDVIYVDPPYNSGARDWKYNNDYVDGTDRYRHSKWLSFMERRLLLARDLLADDGVLILTIDEKEVHHAGALLEQLFPNAIRQMVTIVINPLGQARKRELARVEEYAFFVFLGASAPASIGDDLLSERKTTKRAASVRWEWLIRGGTHSQRWERPNLFYPVFVDPVAKCIAGVGDSLPKDASIRDVAAADGLITTWPISTNGKEGNWRCSPQYLRSLVDQGYARVGAYDKNSERHSLLYLGKAQIKRIESGQIKVVGRDGNGVVQLEGDPSLAKRVTAKTVWNRLSHRAGEHGSALVKKFVPGRDFPFPKSLYALTDCLRIATADRPDAVILDYFAGSGTTAHAAMLLNLEDGGSRRSIMVTNNEVSEDESQALIQAGHRPGDPAWEARGIFDYITRPRLSAAVTGKDTEGHSLVGSYLNDRAYADGLAQNVDFFELHYLDRNAVSRGKAFEAIAPLLWLKAGAQGARIEQEAADFSLPHDARYGVLFDVSHWAEFRGALDSRPDVTHAFVVTDSLAQYQQVIAALPPQIEGSMLYEDYLRNFEINTREGQ